MRQSFLSLLLFTACAHQRPVPPAFGFSGVQCVETREVMCVLDKELARAECDTYVRPAIAAINMALGRPMYHFAGYLDGAGALAIQALIAKGTYVIQGVSPEAMVELSRVLLHETAREGGANLGLTITTGDKEKVQCIATARSFFNRRLWFETTAQPVVTHEMLHALGAWHAAQGGAFHSIMTPRVQAPGWADHLTAYDIAALRAAYGD